MAHIEVINKGKNKKYKVIYEIPSASGTRQRKSKTFPVGTPKSVVDEFKLKMEIAAVTGDFAIDKKIGLCDFIENVYFPVYTKFLSKSTIEGYRNLYDNRHDYCVKRYFRNCQIATINRRFMQQYVNLLSDHVKPKTVRSYILWLHSVFKAAITEEIIKPEHNPTSHLRLPPRDQTVIEAYTADEINKLLELSKDDEIAHITIGLGALAGLRRGEMAGLKWENVDLAPCNAVLHIKQNMIVVYSEVIVKNPKTKAGMRDIPIPEVLAGILRRAKQNYMLNKLRIGKDFKDEGYVLSKEDGTHYSPDGISIHYERFMKRIEKEHGIPYKSLHKLRHSYATLLIDSGANPKVVQKNLGHEDVTMTLGTYVHAYADRQREEVDKLDSVISLKKHIG